MTVASRPALDLETVRQLADALRPAPVAPVAPVLPIAAVSTDAGLSRSIGIVVQALAIGVLMWVGATVSELSKTVAVISSQVTSAISDMKDTKKDIGDIKEQQASLTAHDAAQDGDISRMKDRLRVVEHQAPVGGDAR